MSTLVPEPINVLDGSIVIRSEMDLRAYFLLVESGATPNEIRAYFSVVRKARIL